MKTSRTKIAQAIAERSLEGGVSRQLSQEVAAYLLAERRINELDSVLRDVQADWADAGYVEVIATSAHALTAEAKVEISHQIKQLYPAAKQIIVTEVHNPDVLGGVTLRLANRQLDLSVEGKLNKFRQLTTTGKD